MLDDELTEFLGYEVEVEYTDQYRTERARSGRLGRVIYGGGWEYHVDGRTVGRASWIKRLVVLSSGGR